MTTPVEKQMSRTIYVLPCKVCGRECEVSRTAVEIKCWECANLERAERALAEQAHLFNAFITDIVMSDTEEFESVTVRTVDDRLFKFTVGGWEEHYIEVDEVKED